MDRLWREYSGMRVGKYLLGPRTGTPPTTTQGRCKKGELRKIVSWLLNSCGWRGAEPQLNCGKPFQ
jgi:hypothetical protein